MKKLLLLFACVLAAYDAQAQQAADSMRIFYRRGYRNVDPSFRDNRTQPDRFLRSIDAALDERRIEKIIIRSYASPDGQAAANERLAARRAEELKAYLVREGDVPAELIEHHAEGIAWGMLREQVAASDMEGRDEVLDILDHTPVWIRDADGRIVDGRKKRLMDLRGGAPYRYMLEHLFPDLRNSSNTMLYLRLVAKQTPPAQTQTAPEPAPATATTADATADARTAAATAPATEPATEPATVPAGTPAEEPAAAKPARTYPKRIFGIYAGYCTSWITSYGLASSTRPGYEAGVTGSFRITRRLPLYLRTGMGFVSKGYEIRGFDDSRTTMNYLQIPLGVECILPLGGRFALVPGAGCYYAVGVGGQRKIGRQTGDVFGAGGFSRHDMGFDCGIDLAAGRFSLGVAYRIGLINIDKHDPVYGGGNQMIGYKNVRNRSVVVRAGVSF